VKKKNFEEREKNFEERVKNYEQQKVIDSEKENLSSKNVSNTRENDSNNGDKELLMKENISLNAEITHFAQEKNTILNQLQLAIKEKEDTKHIHDEYILKLEQDNTKLLNDMKTLENDHNKLKESKRKKLDQEPEKK